MAPIESNFKVYDSFPSVSSFNYLGLKYFSLFEPSDNLNERIYN